MCSMGTDRNSASQVWFRPTSWAYDLAVNYFGERSDALILGSLQSWPASRPPVRARRNAWIHGCVDAPVDKLDEQRLFFMSRHCTCMDDDIHLGAIGPDDVLMRSTLKYVFDMQRLKGVCTMRIAQFSNPACAIACCQDDGCACSCS